MSEVVGEAVIKVRTDETGVDIDGAGKRAGTGYSKGFLGGIKNLALGIGGVLAAAGTVNFLKDSIGEAREAQKVGATTTSIIKATGQAAGVTADQVSDMAGRLSSVTGIDDEAIQSGSNLLLTFKNVKNYVDGQFVGTFDRATASALDLSAAGFGSIESASKTLGKALNDPVKGVSALSRAGVTFTQQQKDQIATLVESGDVLGAQNIILKEVEGQVGGVAEAQATAGAKAKVAFDNLKESVGTALLPVLDRLATFFVDSIVPALYDGADALSQLGPLFSAVGDFISGAFSGSNGTAVTGFFASIQSAAEGVLPVLADLFTGTVLPAVEQLASALQDGLGQVLPVMAETFTGTVLPAVTALADYIIANVVPIFSQVVGIIVDSVIPAVVELATFFYGTLYPAFIQIATAILENLKPVFDQLVETFRTQILPTIQELIEQIRTQLIPALEPVIVVVVQVIGFLARLAATVLGVLLPPLIRLAGFIIANVLPAIVGIITFLVRLVGGIFSVVGAVGRFIGSIASFASALNEKAADAVRTVVNAITGLPGKILALGPKLLEAGKGIMGKFLDGLRTVGSFASSIADAVYDAVKGVINGAIDRLNSLLEFTINVGPKSFTVNPPNIGHLQVGSLSTQAGTYIVGEAGPERVILPDGARVDTAAQTRQSEAASTEVLAAILAALQSGVQRPNIIAQLPTGDPEAAAMAIMNRFVAAGTY